jgi:hypothetical protein
MMVFSNKKSIEVLLNQLSDSIPEFGAQLKVIIVLSIETTLNTQDNDPPDPIRSSNRCKKITEAEDEQLNKIMEATSETLEDKNENN